MRAICIVLDSVGIGAMPDAAEYGDAGSGTLPNLARATGGLNLPNLGRLGLGNITDLVGVPRVERPEGSYGKMRELSPGKDTTTGHWEMMGIRLEFPFPLFPDGFPAGWLREFEQAIGRGTIGNFASSGTEIIMKLGDEHVRTGKPIVYTSADSVFQVAAHEEVIPLEDLYKICKTARAMLQPPKMAVGRVIARPFIGTSGAYKRTTHRHDFSLDPTTETLLDVLKARGIPTYGIGKIFDIFAGKGVDPATPTEGNEDGMRKTLEALDRIPAGFIFTNLVDTDMIYGHRRDTAGYKKALEDFDRWLGGDPQHGSGGDPQHGSGGDPQHGSGGDPQHGSGGFLSRLGEDDLLIISADHGCDPTFKGSDHTREYVPLLVYRKGRPGRDLGTRDGFWDIAASVARHLQVPYPFGTPFN